MGIETFMSRVCKQTAVYWGDPQPDGYGGQTFDSEYPTEIKARWEDKAELYMTSNGEQKVSRAIVYVLEDLDEGGFLYFGTLEDLDSDGIMPDDVSEAYPIKKFDKSPALVDTSQFVRKAYL